MTVLGVGLDLVDIRRIQRMLDAKGERVYARLLTEAEHEYCRTQSLPARHVAARIAAKEATYKALQAAPNSRAIGWRDTEVIRDDEGRPALRLHGLALEAATFLKVANLFISLTHTDDHAAAVVVLDG